MPENFESDFNQESAEISMGLFRQEMANLPADEYEKCVAGFLEGNRENMNYESFLNIARVYLDVDNGRLSEKTQAELRDYLATLLSCRKLEIVRMKRKELGENLEE